MVRLRTLTIILSALLLASCSRSRQSNRSQITIQAPNQLFSKGVGALEALPTTRTACYGINITGTAASTTANSCSPPLSIVAGFVEAGSPIQASVTKGQTIGIELYLYLQPAGKKDPCPVLLQAIPPEQLANIYMVGSALNISTDGDDTVVNITAAFPGLTQNIAKQLALPATCLAASANTIRPFRITSDFRTVAEQGVPLASAVRLMGRVGSATPLKKLTATDGSSLVFK